MISRWSLAFAFVWVLPLACSSQADPQDPPAAPVAQGPAPELGGKAGASLVEILGPAAGLARPRDLAFNPLRADELWIVNEADNSVVIVHAASTDARTSERRRDAAADHFLHKPSSIAFGAEGTTFDSIGTFGTCGESRNENGIEGAEDFMGPALWTSDLEVFAKKDPIGLGSHLDMLHNSPLCMGIAHEKANVYWVVTGSRRAITRYDFGADHHIGLDDHSDGASLEYAFGEIGYVPGVPSHLAFRAEDAMLYVADTGNGRVVRLDTKSGVRGRKLATKEPQNGGHYKMDGATLVDVVPPGTLTAPSGLELRNDHLYVSDNGTGKIVAFDLQGQQVASFDTGLGAGALAGMAFGPDGKLYVVDMVGSRVLRVDPN